MKDNHKVFIDTFAGKSIIRITNIEDIDTDTRVIIDFCPKCGTPLGEVNPLTVEQLKEREGKPVFVVDNEHKEKIWCIIANYNNSVQAEIAGCDHFWYEQKNYGTTWVAFDREPKGKWDEFF